MQSVYSDVEHYSTVSLMEIEIGWLITGVEVNRKFRGHGYASKLIGKVLEEADRERTTLLLTVDPDGTGMNHDQLRTWYSKLGFIPYSGEEDSLIRNPVL